MPIPAVQTYSGVADTAGIAQFATLAYEIAVIFGVAAAGQGWKRRNWREVTYAILGARS
jgi:hypothetical protein